MHAGRTRQRGHWFKTVIAFGMFLAGFDAGSSRAGAAPPAWSAYSTGEANVTISQRGEDYIGLGIVAWGPNWAWTGVNGPTTSEQGATVSRLAAKFPGTSAPIRIGFRASRPTPRQMRFEYQLEADADTELTMIAVELSPGKRFHGRDAEVTALGKRAAVRCPFEKRGLGKQVELVRMTDAESGTAVFRFDPPCDIASDGPARVVLAEGRLPAGETRRLVITAELPNDLLWYPGVDQIPDEPGLSDWYPFQATGDTGPSVIGMADWLERPAGQHGRIVRHDDDLIYNHRPLKLWGLNLCYGACAPEKSLADRRAPFYAKYGINAVRLHKFADGPGWAGIQSAESFVEFDTEGLDRMDYQVARFKQAGIYVKLSAHFGSQKLGPADKKYVPYLEEFGSFRGRNERIETPHSAVHYSPELQQVQILQMVNLLQHKNPYTGQTYAEDPAVAFIEIINEQSILFFTSMAPLKASGTLRRQAGQRFCDWLRAKYGTQEQLTAAWGGPAAFDSFQGDGFPAAGEHLDKDNILPLGNPWYWDPEQLNGSQAFRKQRLLDSLHFLYLLECDFFRRYEQAVRAAGYGGEMVGSNWQAGRAFSHFANLHADYQVGTIDRHNYFGADRANASMLARAGSGMLSSGMQQVIDRPFMLSEWIHVAPNEMGVEGPAIIGAYGMGLQGWDVSFLFQNKDVGSFSDRIARERWDVTAPQILGVFPAVARQVLRGDVRQSPAIAVRNVHAPSLFAGKLSIEDRVVQGYDIKELDGTQVSARSLAAVRSVVAFTDQYLDTPAFDLRPFERDGQIVSATGQLRWQESDADRTGFFTIDTPGTKAVVGLAGGGVFKLGSVTIEPRTPFGAIYVTAREPTGTIESSRELLVVALARARNTGMKFSPDGRRLLAAGGPPILMEPVQARITLNRPGAAQAIALDHDGRLTTHSIPMADGTLTIDAATLKSPYILVRY